MTISRAERFSYAARSNEVICPYFQKCGNSGTFVRAEIYKDLKFGPKDAGKVLNQRAEQCRRVKYEEFVTRYENFEQVYAREFAPKFNKKRNQIPPVFTEFLRERVKKLTAVISPRVKCDQSKLIIFVKTGRNHFFDRKVIRLVVGGSVADAALFFVLGSGDSFGEEIRQESENFVDLIIAEFEDNYENLALKTQMAYQYGSENCNPGMG